MSKNIKKRIYFCPQSSECKRPHECSLWCFQQARYMAIEKQSARETSHIIVANCCSENEFNEMKSRFKDEV